MSKWLTGLNSEQKKAVSTLKGPLLVLAGAGSGKTLVITRRIAFMLDQGIPPGQILGVTFTNKAANEMRARLVSMLGSKANKVTLSTFHALGLFILKTELNRRKSRCRFVVFDTGDQLSSLREIARKIRLGRNYDLGAILSRIRAYKNAFLPPEQVDPGDDPYAQAAAAFYPAYLEALEAFAAVDFDDLICRPVTMLESSKACKKRWSSRFRYVLVDEYQDTNRAQLRMLRAIAGGHRNLCVVGDDDQSIYGWRGAEIRNILEFEKDFPGCKTVNLMRNYRSQPNVLHIANQIIAQNPRRHPKKMKAVRKDERPVSFIIHPDGETEASWIAERVNTYINNHRYQPSNIAVLYRSALLSRGLETAFRIQQLPYRVLGGISFFERKEVKDLLAYLRLCIFPTDAISLRRVINYPQRGIGPVTIKRLSTWAEEHNQPLYRAVERARFILGDERAIQAVNSFWSLIQQTRKKLKSKQNLVSIVESLIEEIELYQDIWSSSASEQAAAYSWSHVENFLDGLRAYCQSSSAPTLYDYLNQISLNELELDTDNKRGNLVTLSTLHGAKGLEFPIVFLVGLEEGLLPHDRVINPHETDVGSGDLSEELRLCYVGVTRAKDELVLTRAAQRMVRGKLQPRAPSRFISEIKTPCLQIEDRTKTLSPSQARNRLAQIRAMLSEQ